MSLETLKGLEGVDGEKILQERARHEDGSIDWQKTDELRKDSPIFVDHDVNMVSFRIQNGPVKENGKNGCQVTALIAVARHMIGKLNDQFPCLENKYTLQALDEALAWQQKRTENRKERGVEGENKA